MSDKSKTIKFIQKDIKLSADFSRHVSGHKDVFKDIPKNRCIIVTDKKDKNYNAEKVKLSKEIKNKSCYLADKSNGRWILHPAR